SVRNATQPLPAADGAPVSDGPRNCPFPAPGARSPIAAIRSLDALQAGAVSRQAARAIIAVARRHRGENRRNIGKLPKGLPQVSKGSAQPCRPPAKLSRRK